MKCQFPEHVIPLKEIPRRKENKFTSRMSQIGFVVALCLTRSALAASQNPPGAAPDHSHQYRAWPRRCSSRSPAGALRGRAGRQNAYHHRTSRAYPQERTLVRRCRSRHGYQAVACRNATMRKPRLGPAPTARRGKKALNRNAS
jgi:hypothetical protein